MLTVINNALHEGSDRGAFVTNHDSAWNPLTAGLGSAVLEVQDGFGHSVVMFIKKLLCPSPWRRWRSLLLGSHSWGWECKKIWARTLTLRELSVQRGHKWVAVLFFTCVPSVRYSYTWLFHYTQLHSGRWLVRKYLALELYPYCNKEGHSLQEHHRGHPHVCYQQHMVCHLQEFALIEGTRNRFHENGRYPPSEVMEMIPKREEGGGKMPNQ